MNSIVITIVITENTIDQKEKMDNVFSDSDDDHDDVEVSIHHKVHLALQNMDWTDLIDMIYYMDFGLMDEEKCKEAHNAKELLLSIHYGLKKHKIILRASYKGDGFHAFQAKYFHRKASIYMKKMRVYSVIQQLNGPYPEIITQRCLANIVDRVETTLDDLYNSKCLSNVQHAMMDIQRAQVQLNYLYFVPEIYKVCFLFLSFHLEFISFHFFLFF